MPTSTRTPHPLPCRRGRCPRPTEVPLGDIDPRLSGRFRMLTAACRQAALQHHRRPSLELVGGGVHDAPLHRAVPQGDFLALCAHSVDKRQPLQGLRNALGLVVGRGALTPPRTVAHRPSPPSDEGGGKNRRFLTEGENDYPSVFLLCKNPAPLTRGAKAPTARSSTGAKLNNLYYPTNPSPVKAWAVALWKKLRYTVE